ncbi:GntR family transcriptional regulator [Tsukamurella soli]|uniref:GntR family transcriptional regulator n=1 Tax=Tsukamurella soli TaxID=644556 RepID=A0ABP8KC71_9ACTN
MPPPSRLIAGLPRLRPGASQEVILDQLRRAILETGAAPGAPIPVEPLAEHFGVSRIPVRESLKTLVGEGLIEHRPNGGYTVARVSHAELLELYLVRAALETAAHTVSVTAAGARDHAQARSAFAAVDAAVRERDVMGYHRESRRFHLALATPCRMHRLLHMLESAWNITEPVRPMGRLTAEQREVLNAGHAPMLAAFVAGDGDALAIAAARHDAELRAAIASARGASGV